MDNLLEKITKDQNAEEYNNLDATKIVSSLFAELLDREKDILSRRFGLGGDKVETLEKIGGLHNLTRERVRQIESASIKKIKKLENLESSIEFLKRAVNDLLDENGGLIRRDYLLDILTVICLELNNESNISEADYEKNRRVYRNHFDFIISKLMGDNFEVVDNHENFNSSFKTKDQDIASLEELAKDLLSKVDTLKKTLKTEELLDLLKELDTYNKNKEQLSRQGVDITKIFKSQVFPDPAELINNNKILYSLMQSIKNLEQNKYGEWGLSDWQEIKPKTVNDKIYLVLKHAGKPLHFTDIAKQINEIQFDHKTANAATVHNELILDNRYVLVGRGTYGLKEWAK